MLDASVLDGVGWKVRGDFVPPESHERRAFFPRFRLMIEMVPMFLRYRGLFPRAWREIQIPEVGLTLICEQVSPVIPQNYE
ncbi:hypothetical protein ANCCEY_13236, partial [Ancylostoma ceylanicum]